jgi:surface polysaccharide O-acyltransferase-like enzyme
MSTGSLGERRYDLDWVRVGAFLLLILYHIGMYYVTWDWHVKSPYASSAVEPLMLLTSPWRLSLLFLVSGVATGYLLERQGASGFLGRRSVRLLVPLVFGMLVIVPPQSYLEVVEKVQYAGSYGEFMSLYLTGHDGFCRDGDCLIMPTWNHLWFVAYLWVYTLLLFVVVRFAPGVVARVREWLDRRFVRLAVLWLPIVYLVAARMLLAVRFPSTHALVDDWYNHAVYAPVFLLGFALAGVRAPWETIERLRWHALGLAVLGWTFLCVWHGLDGIDALPASVTLRRIWQGVFSAQIWLAIVAVLGFARRHLNRDNAARRYLTAAVFPVYILHQTVIVVAAHALQPVRLAPLLEGLVLVFVTTALCFLGYEAVRRVPVLRPLLGLAVSEKDGRLPSPVPRNGA